MYEDNADPCPGTTPGAVSLTEMYNRILVTGAGGFIGGRIVEVLHELNPGRVRAAIRRWSSAARIGRLPVEIVQCDVTSVESVRTAMEGVDAVVHCARGDARTNVDGTRIVLDEALRSGVRRVVHLSTVAVYGRQEGNLSEVSPVNPGPDTYGQSKAETELLCAEYGKRGLAIAILRPTIVYGPYSDLWTVEFAHRLSAGEPFLPSRYTQGVCNLVYVDDVVQAVLRSLNSERAIGQTFIVNGEERPTWHEYFQELNGALGLSPMRLASPARARLTAALMLPVRKAGKFTLKHFQPLVLRLYQRSSLAKKLLRRAETAIRNSPTGGEFDLYSLRPSYESAKARELLDYRPAFTMREGVELSAAWLRDHQYV